MSSPRIAALYCRISKSDGTHDESYSIANQKSALEKAAALYSFEHTQFFVDDGYSGTVFDRPAWTQLESAIRADQICAVLVKDISRVGRDYLKVGYYLEQLFPQHKVRFIAVSGGIDSDTNSTDILPLYSVMDEWYAKDISRKIRMMYQIRAAAGIPIGIPVYGYVKSASNPKCWKPDSEAAAVVQYIYQLAFHGYGPEQIAGKLEHDKIMTPAQYRLVHSTCKRQLFENPHHWGSTTVASILRRQEYCGDIINLKTYSSSYKDKKRRINARENMIILRDVHEPIIERSLWDYIQCKLKKQRRRKRAGEQSLFSGFLRCGDCGSNLHYHFNQANPSIEYYNCSNYIGNRGTCKDTHYIRLDDLKIKVLKELNRLIKAAKQQGFWDKLTYQKSIESQAQIRILSDNYKGISDRLKDLGGILTKAYEDKVKGVIDDETFVLLINEFKKERENLQYQGQQVREKLEAARKFQSGLDYFKKMVALQDEILILTRDIIGQFIEWIAIYPADRNIKPYHQKIEIYYQFIGRLSLDDAVGTPIRLN